MSYLIPQSNLIQQSHILNCVTNSIVWSRFTFSSHSTVPHIKQCYKFNSLISIYILILFNSSIYSKVSQINLSHPTPQSNFIQQWTHIKQCYKFNSLISFYILILFNSSIYSNVSQIHLSYPIPQSNLNQQFHILNCFTNSIVWSRFTFLSYSTVPFIQMFHKFTCLIQFHSLISFNSPTY